MLVSIKYASKNWLSVNFLKVLRLWKSNYWAKLYSAILLTSHSFSPYLHTFIFSSEKLEYLLLLAEYFFLTVRPWELIFYWRGLANNYLNQLFYPIICRRLIVDQFYPLLYQNEFGQILLIVSRNGETIWSQHNQVCKFIELMGLQRTFS